MINLSICLLPKWFSSHCFYNIYNMIYLGVDTNFGQKVHFYHCLFLHIDYILIKRNWPEIVISGGQCNSPASGAVATANFLNDRYCGTAHALPWNPSYDHYWCSSYWFHRVQQPEAFHDQCGNRWTRIYFPAVHSEGAIGNNAGFSIGN